MKQEIFEKIRLLEKDRKRIMPGWGKEEWSKLVDEELQHTSTDKEQVLWFISYYKGIDILELDYIEDDRFMWGRCRNETALFKFATNMVNKYLWMEENNIDPENPTQDDKILAKLSWEDEDNTEFDAIIKNNTTNRIWREKYRKIDEASRNLEDGVITEEEFENIKTSLGIPVYETLKFV